MNAGVPIFEPGMMKQEPYYSTPFNALLFRNFTLQFYFAPTVEGWHHWYVVGDFGELVRVYIGHHLATCQPRAEYH